MEKWEIAARNFVEQCEFHNDIEAAFLTGSYAAGIADKYSDIDLYIVLNNNVKSRRGRKRFEGFLIEYYSKTVALVKYSIGKQFDDINVSEINMIMNGIEIMNKNSTVEELRKICTKMKSKGFSLPCNYKEELIYMWNAFDKIERAYKSNKKDFIVQYYHLVFNAFETYSKYILSPIPSYHNLYKWLTDEEFNFKYGLPAYNDQIFRELIVKSLEVSDIDLMFENIGAIKEYINKQLCDIDEDNIEHIDVI